MRAHANAGRRWVALAAMALFVFQALIASSALASSGQGSGQAGATTIICTASGPRVVALDSEDAARHASQQGGALPQCCTAGCALPGGITPPALFLYSWLAPVIHLPRRRLPRLPISPAPWRDCRSGRARLLPPDARYPNETDSRPDRGGHVTAYAASILPGRRRALSPLAFRLVPGYGPRRVLDFRANAKPCLAERRSFKVRRIPMFRKSLIAALVLAAAPQLLWAHAHVGTATPAKDAVLARRRPPSR